MKMFVGVCEARGSCQYGVAFRGLLLPTLWDKGLSCMHVWQFNRRTVGSTMTVRIAVAACTYDLNF